jgi:hypothetical protein
MKLLCQNCLLIYVFEVQRNAVFLPEYLLLANALTCMFFYQSSTRRENDGPELNI